MIQRKEIIAADGRALVMLGETIKILGEEIAGFGVVSDKDFVALDAASEALSARIAALATISED